MGTVQDRHGAEPYCYLTTTGRNSGGPHEIEIWFAARGDTIYLMNGGTRRPPGSSDWVRNARAEPSVTVRIGDEILTGSAREIVFDSAEHEQARDLLVGKYATAEDNLAQWRQTAFPVAIDLEATGR